MPHHVIIEEGRSPLLFSVCHGKRYYTIDGQQLIVQVRRPTMIENSMTAARHAKSVLQVAGVKAEG